MHATAIALRLSAALASCTIGLAAVPAAAQQRIDALDLIVTTTPMLATDYLFRGISQTRSRPAAQLTLDVAHDSGLYLGGFLTNVTFQGTNARQELDILAGYRFEALGVSWDVGGIYYAYPGYRTQPGQFTLDYVEAALKGSRQFGPVKALGAVHVSPNFFGRSGTGVYLEGGLDVTLPYEFTLSGRLAYQWIERNERFGTPDYLWWSVGIARPIPGGITLALGWYDTDISRSDCAGGQKVCAGRVMFSASRAF